MIVKMPWTRCCGACTRELNLLTFLLTQNRIVLRTWGNTGLAEIRSGASDEEVEGWVRGLRALSSQK